MAVPTYYTASYNGVTINAAKISYKKALEYGVSGLVPVKIVETVTIEGVVTKESELFALEQPGGRLYFSIGNKICSRTSDHDIEGGPKPDLTLKNQVGGSYLEISLVVTVVSKDNAVTVGWWKDVVEVDVNYSHDVDARGLSRWVTSGVLITKAGVCADKYRETVLDEYCGDPKGDFVREAQQFKFTNIKTKLQFSVTDNEVFHKPANRQVHFSHFTISSSFDGTEVIKTVDLVIQPLKTPRGEALARKFAQKALQEILFNGLTQRPLLENSSSKRDSKTGEITITASIKVFSSDPNQLSNPTASGVSRHLFWGISTNSQLSMFVSGKRPGLPRGYCGRSACKPYTPKASVSAETSERGPSYKFQLRELYTKTNTGTVPVASSDSVSTHKIHTDFYFTSFYFYMDTPLVGSAEVKAFMQSLDKLRTVIKTNLITPNETHVNWVGYPTLGPTMVGRRMRLVFSGRSDDYSGTTPGNLVSAILACKEALEQQLSAILPGR